MMDDSTLTERQKSKLSQRENKQRPKMKVHGRGLKRLVPTKKKGT